MPVFLRADFAEVRPHFAAFAVDLVAANARRFRPLEEHLFPFRRAAAIENFAIFGDGIVLRLRLLVLLQLLLERRRGSPGRGFNQIELDFLRHVAGEQSCEPADQHVVGSGLLQRAESRQRRLLLAQRTVVQYDRQFRRRVRGLDPALQQRGGPAQILVGVGSRRIQGLFERGIIEGSQRVQRFNANAAGNLRVGDEFGQHGPGAGEGQPACGVNGSNPNAVRSGTQNFRQRGLQGLDSRFTLTNRGHRTPETDDAVAPGRTRPVRQFFERFDAHFFGSVGARGKRGQRFGAFHRAEVEIRVEHAAQQRFVPAWVGTRCSASLVFACFRRARDTQQGVPTD